MKYILIIGDGMADDPLPVLNGKTPLQYASTPAMDRLAGAGVIGSVQTVPDGMPAGSDTAILSIFGCNPREYYGGRAPLEAAARDIKLSEGDIAYRCNMITIESETAPSSDSEMSSPDKGMPFEVKRILSHSAGAIRGYVSDTLIRELFDTPVFKEAAANAGIKIYPGNSFRHIAVQQCQEDDSLASLTLIPPHDHIGDPLGLHLPQGGDNAAVLENLTRLAHDILDTHPINMKRREKGLLPANGIWFWAEGTAKALPNFTERYGKTGSIISAVPLCQGIGVLMGLEKILVKGATGELNTNYEGKADAALNSLKTHDFTAVHVEAPDECTHNGDIKGKLQAIEWIDSRVIARLLESLEKSGTDFKILLMSDHRTLSSTRGHDGGPVPYILYDSRTDKKTGLQYNEADVKKGEFIKDGTKLMDILFA
jgi:2,3-bisphosphoglycerate-independent phosphoglycerate mutase